jgi:hypothetical protein
MFSQEPQGIRADLAFQTNGQGPFQAGDDLGIDNYIRNRGLAIQFVRGRRRRGPSLGFTYWRLSISGASDQNCKQ